jgi:DNA polymerase III subunit gamma/tau
VSSAPSLYRRHRPRTFADVVGQEHVVRTLSNAVEQGKVHHANLFVGSRGTGKTSMAKILAACLNCVDGPTVSPCGSCDSCVSIASATSMDVIEMDAASNNSVDDIRDLRERVAFAPVSGRHKVYILDEAHMLSSQAWNAFLKTLEEPPPNTIFVLATTEANKVLPTVVDRCHRFDFRRPTTEQLASVVRRVATQESIEIGPAAVALLARHATGSFRDALGTLEQLVTYSGNTIALEDVLAVLGVADAELLLEALDTIGAGDARGVLLAADRLATSGRDAATFIRDLEGHARALLIVRTLGSVPAELALSPDQDARLAEQAAAIAPAAVVRLLDLLAGALEATRNGADARTQLELALVKAAAPQVDASTKALLLRIDRLEAALAGAPAAAAFAAPSPPSPPGSPPAASAPASPASPPAPAAAAMAPQTSPEPGQAPAATEPTAPPRAPAPAASPVPPSLPQDAAGRPDPRPVPSPPSPDVPAPPPPEAPAPPPPPPPARTPEPAVASAERNGTTVADESPARVGDAFEPFVAPPAASDPSAQPDPAPVAVAQAAFPGPTLESLSDVWSAVLDAVRAENGLLAAILATASPVGVSDDVVQIAFPMSEAFAHRKATDSANREIVAQALRAITGHPLRPEYELRDEVSMAEEPPPLNEDELIARLKEAFDAEELTTDEEPS